MARALNNLTARSVATLKKPGRHSDGGGLYTSATAGPFCACCKTNAIWASVNVDAFIELSFVPQPGS